MFKISPPDFSLCWNQESTKVIALHLVVDISFNLYIFPHLVGSSL